MESCLCAQKFDQEVWFGWISTTISSEHPNCTTSIDYQNPWFVWWKFHGPRNCRVSGQLLNTRSPTEPGRGACIRLLPWIIRHLLSARSVIVHTLTQLLDWLLAVKYKPECERPVRSPDRKERRAHPQIPSKVIYYHGRFKKGFREEEAGGKSTTITAGKLFLTMVLYQGSPALVTFITAGYPTPDDTVPILLAMQNGGADIIELGIPFSDPVGDGAAIQETNTVCSAYRWFHSSRFMLTCV